MPPNREPPNDFRDKTIRGNLTVLGKETRVQDLVVSGSIDSPKQAPSAASYVVLAANATLTLERVLTEGDGITLTDAGANSTLTVAADVADIAGIGLTTSGTPANIDLATPGSVTVSSTNAAASPHTHAVTSSAAPGAAASLLASTAAGALTLPKIYAKGSPWHDVMAYGAVGDGVADDTAAIQAAIDAAEAVTRGGVVYFPAGKYLIPAAASLTIDASNVTLLGAGTNRTYILVSADASTLPVIDVNLATATRLEYITIKDLTIRAATEAARKNRCGIRVQRVSALLLENVEVRNLQNIGIDLVDMWDCHIRNVLVAFCGASATSLPAMRMLSQTLGAVDETTSYVEATGLVVERYVYMGLYINDDGTATQRADHFNFANCKFHGLLSTDALYVANSYDAVYIDRAWYVSFVGCDFPVSNARGIGIANAARHVSVAQCFFSAQNTGNAKNCIDVISGYYCTIDLNGFLLWSAGKAIVVASGSDENHIGPHNEYLSSGDEPVTISSTVGFNSPPGHWVTAPATGTTLKWYDRIALCTTGAGAFALNLPSAAGKTGREYSIVKADSGAGAVTITPSGAEVINGAASLVLSRRWDAATIVSDGANWVSTSAVAGATNVISAVVSAALTDNTATALFTITTTNETGDVDSGAYMCKVHALIVNGSGAAETYQAAKEYEAHFARAMQKTGTGVNTAVSESIETASVSTDAAAMDIGDITMTVVETSEYVQTVKLQVDGTGTEATDLKATAIVELVYSGFTTAPVIASA